ncbi:MAG: alpha/beta fold hydrolase [Rhodoblastus sp.]|nr:alpha/beta fold hydrolase [Rhodoblastus sp.]MCC2099979.1 alpha/beta fold hydrolase [Hyphomicrobiales bacterium]
MATKIEMREFTTPLPNAGLNVFMRNKRRADIASFGPERTLLMVHGATYPASVAFDLPIEGLSWMDHLANAGFDVWVMDLPGYGRSDRPKELEGPAEAAGPVIMTDTAILAVSAVVEFICARNGLDRLNLLGWSWGTAIMAGYTQDHLARVNKLTLFAPLWLIKGTPTIGDPSGKLGAWRGVTRDEARQRWLRGVPEDAKGALIPDGVFDAFWQAAQATDPQGAAMNPPVLRAPNGVVFDAGRYWMKDAPSWDPSRIECPVLIVIGEWDADTPTSMANRIFPLLTRAKSKKLVLLGRGTHSMALENERHALFAEVLRFLEA